MDHDAEEWRSVEKQEIDRFILTLQTSIKTRFDSWLWRRKVDVIRSDQIDRGHELAWITPFLPAH
jgi:hypothetical protein